MKRSIVVVISLLICACTTPAQRFDGTASDFGFTSQLISSKQFQHKLYVANKPTQSDVLHVYLDGDGTPWERNRWIAQDPTARNPLILRLMAQDKQAAILLGRPCYYGLSIELTCDNKYWTSHRYSKEVVESMGSVLNKWLAKHRYKTVVLIGYSGGGSLAMLMANSIKELNKIVTVSANLDVTAWSKFHGYLGLKGSLNPANQAPLNMAVEQVHIAGQSDKTVPAFIINEFAQHQKRARYYAFEGQDHACCWDEIWLDVLAIIESE